MWDTHCGGLGAGLLAPCRPQGLWHPCPDCLWLTALPPSPPQDSLRCWHFPFYCFEREPRRVEAPLCAWKPCQLSSGGSCPTVPLQALLTQLGRPVLSAPPGPLGQMPAAPGAAAGTPGPPVLFLPGQSRSQLTGEPAGSDHFVALQVLRMNHE